MILNKIWRDPNFIIGGVAIGSNFYKRNDIIENIWHELKKGNSVMLAAPRRAGKTSIMQYMEKNPMESYKLIFRNIQGVDSANDFFERIYTLLLNCLNKMDEVNKWFENFKNAITITKISLDGVEFVNRPIDFLKAINTLLIEINKINEIENIILLLGELPEVLFNINKTNNNDAVLILKSLRNWIQQPEMNKKMKFVLAGSVDIHCVIDKIETKHSDFNDFAIIVDCKPLSDNEAHNYIDWAIEGTTVIFRDELKEYLISKIQYFVPYFINLLLDKINEQARKANNPRITSQNIDTAFEMVVKRSDYFKDWQSHLQNYLPSDDFNFVNEILIHTAHKGHINIQEIYDKAVKYNKTSGYMNYINDLERDGYITETNSEYKFISPFLGAFWKRNNPIYKI